MVAALEHNRGYMPIGIYPLGFQARAQNGARSRCRL